MLEKETLNEVLGYVKCPELPRPLKANEVFVRAIVKVRKRNNHSAYCLASNDGTGIPAIKKMFGSMSQIMEVEEIYPLSVLNASVIPNLNDENDVVSYLVACGENKDYVLSLLENSNDENKAKVRTLVLKHCIASQIKDENSQGIDEDPEKTPTEETIVEEEVNTDSQNPEEVETKEKTEKENIKTEKNEKRTQTKKSTGKTGRKSKSATDKF